MASYQVRFVEDERLPAGHDWMLIRTEERCCLFVRSSRRHEGCTPGHPGCSIGAAATHALDALAGRATA